MSAAAARTTPAAEWQQRLEARYAAVAATTSTHAEELVRRCADGNCAVGEWDAAESEEHFDAVFTEAWEADIALLEYIAELERLAGVQPLRVGDAAQLPLLVAGGSL